MNKKRYSFYEDIANQKGKQLFIEECTIAIPPDSAFVYDKTKFIEDASGYKIEARGILKNVPVARYDEKNANGRIYPHEIGQKIQENKLCEGDDCYGNHADSEESVFDTVGVWHNFNLKESIGYADLYCIGEGGQLILEKVKAKGRAGFSTVSYGSLKEDNVTVDPDTWESGHLADFVAHPSAGVFGTYENIQESTPTKTNILTEDITNKIVTIDTKEQKISEQENKRNVNMIDKLKEAEYKDRTRGAIKAAKVATKLTEAIEDLKSFKDSVPEEMGDCHTRIENTITELATKLEEQVASTHKSLQEKESTLEEISAKYSTLEKAHNQLKEDYNKVTKLVEQTKDLDAKKMTEEIKSLSKNCELMESDISTFKEEVSARDADIACFIKERAMMLEDIHTFRVTIKKMKEALAKKTAKPVAKKGLKEDENEDFVSVEGLGDSEPEDLDLPMPDEDVLDIDLETGEVIDAEDDIVSVDDLGYDDDLDAESLISEDTEATADEIKDEAHEDEGLAGEEITEEEEDDKEDEDEKEMKEEDEDEGSKEDEKEDKAEDDKKAAEKKSESTKIKVRKDVYKHYKEAVAKNPSIADIRREVLSQKKLYDAVKLIEKFTEAKKAKSEMVSLRESSPYKVGSEKKYVFKRD